jgi:hypothetical protein
MWSVERMLYEYPCINESIRKQQKKLNEYLEYQEDSRDILKAQVLSDMPRGSNVGNPVEQTVIKVADMYQERIDEIRYNIKYLMFVDKILWDFLNASSLTQSEMKLIEFMFFEQKKPYQIRSLMGDIGYTQVWRLRDSVMQKLDKFISKNNKTA